MLRILVNLLHDFSFEKDKCKDLINSPTTPLFPFILFTDLSCCEIIILSLHTRFIQLSTFIFLKNTAEERFSKQFSAMLNNLWVTLLLTRIPFDSLFSSMWLSIPLPYPLHRCLIVTAFWAPQLHRLPEKKSLENSVKANINSALLPISEKFHYFWHKRMPEILTCLLFCNHSKLANLYHICLLGVEKLS